VEALVLIIDVQVTTARQLDVRVTTARHTTARQKKPEVETTELKNKIPTEAERR